MKFLKNSVKEGMGVVYKAKDKQLDIDVALKFLPPQISKNERAVKQLKDEAKLSIKLSHPNIMRLFNYEDDGCYQYLVMEYIDGGSLEDRLLKEGKLSEEYVLKILPQLCEGLDCAHKQKILHRDLKPSNIMLTKEGTIKICDFGIARQVKDSMTRLTGIQTSGTLLYMSPEQIRGDNIDSRSDIYSLGIVLYELLSGEVPFKMGDISFQIINKAPKPLEGISEKLNSIIKKCLSKNPEDRFGNTELIIEDIKTNVEWAEYPPKTEEGGHSCPPYKTENILDRQEIKEGKKTSKKYIVKIVLISLIFLIPIVIIVVSLKNQKAHWEERGNEAVLTLSNGVKIEFVKIPSGSFMMGSPDNESGRDSDEGPQHRVNIKSFWMGKYEVTNKQYRAFKSSHDSKDYNGHSLNSDNQPVVNVSWNDAIEFCKWLSSKTGKNFSLPSEAEWEYACRGGTETVRYWGDSTNSSCEYANVSNPSAKKEFNWNWEVFSCEDGYKVSSPTGSFRPNNYGLYDMLGNVWEWCQDTWHSKYEGAPTNGSAWESGGSSNRVLRGGGWSVKPIGCRSADRGGGVPDDRGDFFGFRVARTF